MSAEGGMKISMSVIVVGLIVAAGVGGAFAYSAIYPADIPGSPITTDALMVDVFNNTYGKETSSVTSMGFNIKGTPIYDGILVDSVTGSTDSPYIIRLFSTGTTSSANLYGFFTCSDQYGAVVKSITLNLSNSVSVTLYRDSFNGALIEDASLSNYDSTKKVHYVDYGINSVTINFYSGIYIGSKDTVNVTDTSGVVHVVSKDDALDLDHFGFTFLASRDNILSSA